MSSSEIALSVRGLSKEFIISHEEKHTTLGEKLVAWAKNPLNRPTNETFVALREVSFDVRKGDVVGVIGRNGAGKSTLLKVLSRITPPTTGEVRLFGRVASLLEVGTGFHPELTGRENIYLNGAILGMRRAEIRRQFDAIVDFAEVERFLDTPVKRYSSGMYVRLAFAVAAHLNPEILIVDEVLSVGDMEFQKKCLGKMEQVARGEGRTVLFVSHNMAAVQQLCSRGLMLRGGTVVVDSDTQTAIAEYQRSATKGSEGNVVLKGGEFQCFGIAVETGETAFATTFRPCAFDVMLECSKACSIGVHLVIEDQHGSIVMGVDSSDLAANLNLKEGERGTCRFRIESLPMIAGTYRARCIIRNDTDFHAWEVPLAHEFTVESVSVYGTRKVEQRYHGTTAAKVEVSWSGPEGRG